jgi:hypothetical protein
MSGSVCPIEEAHRERLSDRTNWIAITLSLCGAPRREFMSSYTYRRSDRRLPGWQRVLLGFLIVVAVLVVALLAASPIVKSVVNKKLANLPGYHGSVDAVRLQLWRGGGEIRDFSLYARGHEDDPAVIRVKRASLLISWPALLHGKLGGSAVVQDVDVTVIKREATPKKTAEEKDEKKQKAEEKKAEIERWQDSVRNAFPLELSRFELRDARIHFLDRTVNPQIDAGLTDLHILATGLGNRPEAKDGALPAKVEVQATTTGNGKLHVSVQADPLAKQPRFAANLELHDLELPAFNNFLLAYANADVSRGIFELYIEVNAANGAYEGYTKPFFKDLDFKTASDKDKNAAQLLMKKTVSAVASVLKSNEDKKVATKAPFHGNFEDTQVDLWTTIANLLRNAFLQSLREGLEGQPPPK